MTMKNWIIPPERNGEVERLADSLRLSRVSALALVNRGFTEPGEATGFLQPKLNDLTDPCECPVMAGAARSLARAAREGRTITIYGDYDADGICASALLERCFRFLGNPAQLYIPHRIDEGYGLNHEAIKELAEAGTEVIVTVDCGVCSVDEVAYARELGVEMIITDHHEPQENVPETAHVLDPKLESCSFGYEYLAGVGVAFKLMWAIGQEISSGHRVSDEFRALLMEALALVSIGTVADMVPLVGENRVMVSYGLRALFSASTPGLRALVEAGRIRGNRISARDIGFRLAPKLNAAGRMGHARDAVELLIAQDPGTARKLAEELVQQNRLRRSVQKQALDQAEQMLDEDERLAGQNCIVLARPDWHQGVVGLVASRLTDKLVRPAFVLVEEGDTARGSGRSIPGFSLFDAVCQCEDLLERFGGHDGAAGVTLPTSNIEAFAERLNNIAGQSMGGEQPTPELRTDGDMPLSMLNMDSVGELRRLEPCGQANPKPVFVADNLQLVGYPQIMGKTSLAFWVRQADVTLRAFAGGRADMIDELRERCDEPFALAYQPYINTYRGKASVELRVEDLQWHSERLQEVRE
jgi:single-stranded-DNA-specific exonuclease